MWPQLGQVLVNPSTRFHKGYKFLEILNARENHLDSQTDNIKPVLELKANCNKTFMQNNCLSFQPESKTFHNISGSTRPILTNKSQTWAEAGKSWSRIRSLDKARSRSHQPKPKPCVWSQSHQSFSFRSRSQSLVYEAKAEAEAKAKLFNGLYCEVA